MSAASEILGDWGTSRLRLFRVVRGEVTDRREGPGIAALDAPAEAVLRTVLAPWLADGAVSEIRLCGMVGSRNGWVDVPYVEAPADAARWLAGGAMLMLDGIPVRIMAGLAIGGLGRTPEVMRGEETQIFGAIAGNPTLGQGTHTLALPGTHSKWALVEDGRVTRFGTFLSGELFALLRDHSTLTRAATPDSDPAHESEGFQEGLTRAATGGHLLGALFSVRAMQLRAGRSHDWALGFLSGLIIGREIAEAAEELPTTDGVTLIGDPGLTGRYARALASARICARALDGEVCALAGLMLTERRP